MEKMDIEQMKKYLPYLALAILGIYVLFSKFPHFIPTSVGGSKYSPIETKARKYAINAGQALFNSCGNSGKPTTKYLGVQELNKDRIKIHFQVSWDGLISSCMIKGWVTCDEDGSNPSWTKESDKGAFVPGCSKGAISETLE